MIVAAAVCPHPPVLVRSLSGQQDVVGDLRAACLGAVDSLMACAPSRIVVVGGAPDAHVPASGALNVRGYGTFGTRTSVEPLPLSLGVGQTLLARWSGPVSYMAVPRGASLAECSALGRSLASSSSSDALLVMADGTATRTLKAPGYLDSRAHAFDAGVVQALADGDSAALLDIDAELADELLMQGRAALQVLGAAVPSVRSAEVRLQEDPFGVLYFVAFWLAGEES